MTTMPKPLSRRLAGCLLAASVLLSPITARALPRFARQMDMQCTACHTDFPVLGQYGRQFKLLGYTLAAEQPAQDSGSAAPVAPTDAAQTWLPPVAVMLQPSFTHTEAPQVGGAAPGFSDNNNFAVSQLSVFYAGRLFGPYATEVFGKGVGGFLNKFGIFSQTTYDGAAKAWSWDNTELRFADTATIGEQDLIYGVYANNNPSMQDPWNSTPAWGYPFSGSHLAPGPAASTLIEGGLAQQVVGVGAYSMVADTVYLDLGGYRSLSAHSLQSLGADPGGDQLTGLSPYWRIAVEKPVGDGRLEVGALGFTADTYPGRDNSQGGDRRSDFVSAGRGDLTAMLEWINERENWSASYALGNTANPQDSLSDFKATVDYLYDKTYGLSAQYFTINGSADTGLYTDSPSGSPASNGFVFQLNYLPFNKGGGPAFWPRSNVKFSLQYTVYNKFDGARTNYDGAGSNARGNNTLYAEAWIAF